MEKNEKKNLALKSPKIKAIERNFKIKTIAFTAIILVIAIFATLIAYKLPFSYDMTNTGIFSLTDASREIIDGLDKDVRIGAVYASGNEDAMTKALLEKYDAASDRITVEFVDAQASPALLASWNLGDAKTVANGTIIVNSGERTKLLNDDDMYVNSSSGNIYYGEQDITGAILYVTNDDLPVVYFTTGHGETAASDLTDVTALLTNQAYEVRELVILQQDIPEDADVIVMASPTEDINDFEYELLVKYMQGGGRLLLLADPLLNVKNGSFKYLGAIAWEYGMDIENNYVIEADPTYHLTNSELYIIPRYGDHEITENLIEEQKLIVLPIVRGIMQSDYDTSRIKLDALLASSASSWARYDMEETSTTATSTDVTGPIALACAAERASGKTDVPASRLVTVGDGSFIVGANASAQANSQFFVNCVNWLNGSKASVSVPGKLINSNNMIIRGNDFIKLALICCVAVPAVMFLGAVLIWRSRRNK